MGICNERTFINSSGGGKIIFGVGVALFSPTRAMKERRK